MSDSTAVLVRINEDPFTDPERLALAGFLAGYSGLTREAYALDLRVYSSWVADYDLRLFEVRRAHIEAFARELEARGRARATIARRLGTITCFYRYAEQEGLIEHSPAVHVRRPEDGLRVPRHRTGPQRARRHARRRRTRRRTRPRADLAARPERAARLRSDRRADREPRARARPPHPHGVAQGRQDRHDAARSAHRTGDRPRRRRTIRRHHPVRQRRRSTSNRHAAARIVRRIAKAAGINKHVGPHTLRHGFITAALDAGVPLRDVQEAASHADPRTTMRYDRARVSLDRHATYIVSTFIAGAAR